MNTMQNAEQFQSQLHLYVSTYSPDYWPLWLMALGILLVLMLGVLALHSLLRYKFANKVASEHSEHEEKVYLYSRAVRFWHWSNALLFILLLTSGLANHFALVSPNVTASFVSLHTLCGYLLTACWIGFVLINLFSSNGRHYVIKPQGWFGRALIQTRFYLFGIIKGEDHPFHATAQSKFNPLQQVAYLGVMYALVPLLLISGFLALNPQWLSTFPTLKFYMLQFHFFLAIISLFFIVGHVYLCTTGKTATQTFKSMIDGYHRH